MNEEFKRISDIRLNKDLRKLMLKRGWQMVDEMRKILEVGGKYGSKNATGKLSKSLKPVIISKVDILRITIEAVSYATDVENGQPIGTRVEKEPLLKWMKIRGIDESAVNKIQKKIFEKGVEPFPFVQPVFDKQQPLLSAEIRDLYRTEIEQFLQRSFNAKKQGRRLKF